VSGEFADFVDHPSGYLAIAPRNTLFVRPGREMLWSALDNP